MQSFRLFACLLLCLPLGGCFAVATTAVGETAYVVAQERTVGNAVDDASVLINIKHLYLQKDVGDLLKNVEVKVIEGRVLLTGNVDKPETKIQAVRLVWDVNGVREVIDEIQINDKSGFWNYTRDVWVSTQVRTRLFLAKDIKSINYSVMTVNQVVYLMGIAQNQMELDKAKYIASTTSYVQRVVSYVRLKTDPNRPR